MEDSETPAVEPASKRARFVKSELDKLSEEEKDRFEYFMRSHFNRKYIKDFVTPLLASHIKRDTTEIDVEQLCIAIGSLAKMFVGDVVEASTAVMRNETEFASSPESVECSSSSSVTTNDKIKKNTIRPHHIQEAIRRLTKAGCYPLATSCTSVSGVPLLNVKSMAAASSVCDNDFYPVINTDDLGALYHAEDDDNRYEQLQESSQITYDISDFYASIPMPTVTHKSTESDSEIEIEAETAVESETNVAMDLEGMVAT